ncbi:MAG: hypothetical protein FWH05_02520 [Oscillospiraceae bacterium]|nr:hypothetical protein [Oscillospiraceae bacterium]
MNKILKRITATIMAVALTIGVMCIPVLSAPGSTVVLLVGEVTAAPGAVGVEIEVRARNNYGFVNAGVRLNIPSDLTLTAVRYASELTQRPVDNIPVGFLALEAPLDNPYTGELLCTLILNVEQNATPGMKTISINPNGTEFVSLIGGIALMPLNISDTGGVNVVASGGFTPSTSITPTPTQTTQAAVTERTVAVTAVTTATSVTTVAVGANTQANTIPKKTDINAAAARVAINRALANAAPGKKAVITFDNAQNLTRGALTVIINAVKANPRLSAVVVANNRRANNTLDVRLGVNVSRTKTVVNLSASTQDSAANTTLARFNRHFTNNITVLNMGQKTAFGQTISVALKPSKPLRASNARIYSYNPATNRTRLMRNTNPRLDKNGFLHFNITTGGQFIISDGQLTSNRR